jgi:hypothetical protein
MMIIYNNIHQIQNSLFLIYQKTSKISNNIFNTTSPKINFS